MDRRGDEGMGGQKKKNVTTADYHDNKIFKWFEQPHLYALDAHHGQRWVPQGPRRL